MDRILREADFIVVGAGSAGSVVASRLSASPTHRVVLLEAGGSDRNPLFRVPLMSGVLLRNRYANWFYHTEPEPHLEGRRIFWPRGKVLGGSSTINGMVYTRGLPSDYDCWAQMGLPDWSFERVLPAFRRIERHHAGASEWHGGEGPVPVSRPGTPHPLYDAYIAAGRAAGFPFTEDFNGPQPEGFGRYDFTTRRGERWSAARAFLDPARKRPNLRIVTGAHLLRVIVEGHRARGVEIATGGRVETIHAASEVILCCGTVNSPQALMLSGIGDGDLLRRLGIPVRADLKDVGRNLQDHLLVRVEHACTQPITLHRITRADRAAAALAHALLFGTGPAATFPIEAGAYLRSDPALDQPDLQSFFLPGLSSAALRLPFLPVARPRHDGHGFFANVYQLRPESRGEIVLRSADPKEPPAIRPNYLSSLRDRQVLRAGAKILRDVFAQAPFDGFRGAELSPGPDVRTDAELDAWIARTADAVFHPVGTCRMGADDGAVVDGALRVRGVDGLRVADASIMPTMPSGNTHAPTMMVAEMAAGFILRDAGARP
ncbi:GMC family oxidoreductase [Falsiroseomonas sp.]|uniref:GMC family oxidoreductase n=1 Tax=Falsiroseomonas sp. TaxID=2870721 RepID=UPI0035693B45